MPSGSKSGATLVRCRSPPTGAWTSLGLGGVRGRALEAASTGRLAQKRQPEAPGAKEF